MISADFVEEANASRPDSRRLSSESVFFELESVALEAQNGVKWSVSVR